MAVAIVNRRNKIHPWKFALWIGCGSITMMFAAWTSAYVVRQAAGNWLEYKMPNIFFINTAVLLLSSITLHFSYLSFKREKELLYKGLLVLSTILGLGFVVLQYVGWRELYNIGVHLTGEHSNASGQFMYVFTSFHAAHVLGGVAVLFIALAHAFVLPFKPTAKRKLRFELTLTYWHFVDILWIYLFSFFLLQS
jgi:cytochrome c oxidase subunit III